MLVRLKKDDIFTANHRLINEPMKFRYIKKLKTTWHLIYCFESGNTFEVEDEWFRQRKIKGFD